MFGRGGVHGIGHPILLGLSEMVHQQIPRDRRDPGNECTLAMVIARESAVHLDEDLLGEVLGIIGGAGEAVTEVVNAPIIGLHDFLPGSGVAGNTSPNQHRNDLDVFHLHSPEIALLRLGLNV